MLARVLPPLVAKEIRALLPLWTGALVSLLGLIYLNAGPAITVGPGRIDPRVLLLYAALALALGALSIGQEYSARSLPLLLSQPISRARIFLVKQTVLALMLLSLAAVVWATAAATSDVTALLLALSVVGGLFVAPWLTMVSRNPLAGAVFTMAIPGVLLVFLEQVATPRDAFFAFSRAFLAVSVAAAALGWRTFLRLEAIDGPAADLRWTAAAASPAAARRRHPIWLLVKKELGLQQLTFAVASIYLLSWVAVPFLRRDGLRSADLYGAITFVYSGFLSLVIGSLASAEERRLATLQSQLLLAMASWKQWMVKAGTTLGLALVLAVALPAVLIYFSGGHVRIGGSFAGSIVLLTAVSLYVSSLCNSGLKALFASVPVSLFVVIPALAFLPHLGWLEFTPAGAVLFAAALALILYFALVNHRSAERGAWRICVQVFCIAGCFTFCAVVVAALSTSHVTR